MDTTSYKSFNSFGEIWFEFKESGCWSIVHIDTKYEIGYAYPSGKIELFKEYEEAYPVCCVIESEWVDYKRRPEYLVGSRIDTSGDADRVILDFRNLLKGTLLCRAYKAGKDVDKAEVYIDEILDWLDSTDFYVAPASTIYHESFKHGLLWHTLSVYNNMLELLAVNKFSNVQIDSATLCCLVHDWCKIGLYEQYKRNVKNEKTGQWEQKDSYKRKDFSHPFGHGVASMFMASKIAKLTEEEALAIRWHMSMFNVSSNEVNEYQQACEKYPLVHLLQFADQLSITSY